MAIVEDWILVDDSAAVVLVEGDVKAETGFHAPLDGLCEFKGRQPLDLARCAIQGSHLDALWNVSHSSFSSQRDRSLPI